MAWSLRRFSLTKDVPLTISRGTTAAVVRLELSLARDGCVGRGETGGFETGHRAFALDEVERDLLAVLPRLEGLDPTTPQQFDPLLAGLSPPARCAVDLALWDWWAQRLGQPLWGLWGLDGERSVATSVTLGLAAVPAVLERLALLSAVALAIERRSQEQGHAIELQVDANGGWSLEQARRMLEPLQSRAVVLLEQPLAPDADAERDRQGFADLHPHCPMPLVADESCWDLKDLLRLAPVVDGVNLKLLKTGGLAPAVLMARVAAALGLDLMVGCYSDSTLLNGAAAQLLPWIRWPDLDSHLNLVDDPFRGLPMEGDRQWAPPDAGLGISLREVPPC